MVFQTMCGLPARTPGSNDHGSKSAPDTCHCGNYRATRLWGDLWAVMPACARVGVRARGSGEKYSYFSVVIMYVRKHDSILSFLLACFLAHRPELRNKAACALDLAMLTLVAT